VDKNVLKTKSFGFAFLNTAHDLYQYVKENITGKLRTYIFLDEIQEEVV